VATADSSPLSGAPSEFRVSVTEGSDAVVVAVSGELDVASAPALRQELYRVIDQDAPKVVVDLAEMEFIDSTGLGVLVGALKRVKERSGTLGLRALSPSARRVFDITGLSKAFTICSPRPKVCSGLGERSSTPPAPRSNTSTRMICPSVCTVTRVSERA
jgi:anti-sigma B factor antagonist